MASGNEIGTAYVKILPSMDGMKKNLLSGLNSEAGNAGKESGENMGSNLMSTLKSTVTKLAATIGIGKIIKESFDLGADLEQQIGGIETLFNESADKMREYANEAYKTAGVSANDYMSQATSFAASLKQTLSDADAAEYANRAIIDMSDNANKMGTSIENIQNAYQGFAKQNYTMLDNLKLGYGGTKTEMERLISDASKMTDIQKELNVTVEDGDLSFSNIVNAISVMQESMGIAGTTAKEAATTFSGSFASMKAAAQNFLATFMMNGSESDSGVVDVTPALQALLESVNTFVFGNLIPAIGRMIGSVFQLIPTLVGTYIPQLITTLSSKFETFGESFENSITNFINSAKISFAQNGSQFLQVGTDIITNVINGFINGFTSITSGIANFITFFCTTATQYLPSILQIGVDIVTNIINGLLQAIPTLISQITTIFTSCTEMTMTSLPQFLQAGYELIFNIVQGITEAMPSIFESIGTMLTTIISTIVSNLPQFLQSGIDLILQILEGIGDTVPSLLDTFLTMIENLLDYLIQNMPQFLQNGVELITQLATGIANNLPKILATMAEVLSKLISKIAEHFPKILTKGVELLGKLASGIVQAIPDLLGKIPDILVQLAESFMDYDWLGLGADILSGIADGIADAVTGLVDTAIKACGKLVDSVKEFFGIASPSKLFRDEIGEFIPAGISVGIEGNLDSVKESMDKMNDTIYGSAVSEVNGTISTDVSSAVSTANRQLKNVQGNGSSYVTNYGGVTINIQARDGQSVKQLAKEVEKIFKNNSDIEDRGRLQTI